jgi:hypothetical protein
MSPVGLAVRKTGGYRAAVFKTGLGQAPDMVISASQKVPQVAALRVAHVIDTHTDLRKRQATVMRLIVF